MKIYRLEPDVENYQYFKTRRGSDGERLRQIAHDCHPQEENWLPPTVFVYKPKLKAGDFYDIDFVGGLLVVNRRAAEALEGFFTETAELLPIYYEEATFWLVNVTKCLNCLDRENTQWEHTKQLGNKLIRAGIQKPAFYRNLLPEGGLLKIPERCSTEILVLVRSDRPEYDDFVYNVGKHRLEGLTFREIWSDEGS